jgi:general secretion pathway protein G
MSENTQTRDAETQRTTPVPLCASEPRCWKLNVRRARQRGFTLIELIFVVAIMIILISIAIPNYQSSVIRAREAVLRDDLFTMRRAIDEYTMDKQAAPQSLEDLVSGGYMKSIPKDPFTNASDTWQVVQEDVMLGIDQTQPGITDVHSGAQGTSSDGTAYNTW